MKISRREFIKDISSASLLLWGGSVLNITSAEAEALSKKSTLRFIVASDGHYGQAGTEFDSFQESLIKHTSAFHSGSPLDFCVINGDIIHDGKDFLVPAKAFLDKLPVKYYVTKGNHDMVSDEYWNQIWGMPVNHDVALNNNGLLFATTSNEKGEYLSPDLGWMKTALEKHSKRKNVFIFIHIPQAKWTKNGIETPAFFELIKKHKNVRAVFHGHEHDQDNVK
ncbi:MAG TPA: metallophosphoesterase, partial [Chryseolinea sp.]